MSDLRKMSNEELVDAMYVCGRRTADETGLKIELLRRLNRKPKALEWFAERDNALHAPLFILGGFCVYFEPNNNKWGLACEVEDVQIEYYDSQQLALAAAQAHHEAKLAKWFEESPNA